MNREYSYEIIQKLLDWGVEEFYICAGARNIPLIEVACSIQSKKKIIFNHFEERSAAFYALGRIKSIQKPVAVITTSGTAVGELFPAVMEAYYSCLPLVLLTADKPKSYQGTGAPQSAEQFNIFGIYVSKCLDLNVHDTFSFLNIPKNIPLHINLHFDEPLQSGILKEIHINKKSNIVDFKEIELKNEQFLADQLKLEKFLIHGKNTIVIISQLLEKEKESIVRFVKNLALPVYIESISNLRESPDLEHLRIQCADKIWDYSKKSGYFIDSVLKIGRTPTHRFWRDLNEINKDVKVLSISDNKFSGIPNAEHIFTCINNFFKRLFIYNPKREDQAINAFINYDRICFSKMIDIFNQYPTAEQSLYYHLSRHIQKNGRVYLGNSLPIRYWDLSAIYTQKNIFIDASRGLNGIDGQISSFLGFAEESAPENWGIFGDLTALYDLAGLWMLQHRPHLNVNLVVINNGGGKIFTKVIKGDISNFCQNSHQLHFESIAQFWKINYEKISNISDISSSKFTRLIEIIPDGKQTEIVSKMLEEL